MARERINRPNPTPGGRDVARAETAEKLASLLTGGRDRGEVGARIDHLTGRTERSARELITSLGGTAAAARELHVHPSTTRRWANGSGMTDEHWSALNKAARRVTVQQFGGSKQVAEVTGRSRRTVQQWVSKPTYAGGDALHKFNRHEIGQRHDQGRQDSGLAPRSSRMGISLRCGEAHVTVNPGNEDYQYEYDRLVHSNVPDSVIDEALDQLARGNVAGAHETIERHLSYNYSNVDEYDPQQGSGFFIDKINDSRGFGFSDWRDDI